MLKRALHVDLSCYFLPHFSWFSNTKLCVVPYSVLPASIFWQILIARLCPSSGDGTVSSIKKAFLNLVLAFWKTIVVKDYGARILHAS